MLTLYKHLLRLYPALHRRVFGGEMLAIFSELQSDALRKGAAGQFCFCLREGSGLLMGAWTEYWREFMQGRFYMRSDFRFPRATWVLMTIILAGVIMAIEKGEAISVSVPPMSPAIPPIHPAHGLLGSWGLSFLIMYLFGVIVGGILFVVRRRSSFDTINEKS